MPPNSLFLFLQMLSLKDTPSVIVLLSDVISQTLFSVLVSMVLTVARPLGVHRHYRIVEVRLLLQVFLRAKIEHLDCGLLAFETAAGVRTSWPRFVLHLYCAQNSLRVVLLNQHQLIVVLRTLIKASFYQAVAGSVKRCKFFVILYFCRPIIFSCIDTASNACFDLHERLICARSLDSVESALGSRPVLSLFGVRLEQRLLRHSFFFHVL